MTPTTIDDFRPDRIHGVLQRDDWAIISAHVAPLAHVSAAVWRAAMRDRKTALNDAIRKLGHTVWAVTGRYDGVSEESFLVLGIKAREAAKLGHEFSQWCILTGKGLLRCTSVGTLVDAVDLEQFYEPDDRAVGIEVLHTDHSTGDYTRIHAARVAFRVITAGMQAERDAAKVAA